MTNRKGELSLRQAVRFSKFGRQDRHILTGSGNLLTGIDFGFSIAVWTGD